MPECIVCKANYTPGDPCPRCGADNSGWEEWKREEEALSPEQALLRFLTPHFCMPLLIAGWALAFGLLGMLWPWGGVRPPILVLAIALTFAGCVLAAQDVYTKRFELREQELLRRVKRGRQKGIGLEMQTLLVPGITLILAMSLTVSMVQSETVWKLMEWLVLEDTTTTEEVLNEGAPPSQEEPGIKEKVRRVFPLMCLSGYVTLAAFAYSSSLMLAREYARRLNERLPQPIFLREDSLIEVVQREARNAVHRAITPRVIGGEETPTGVEQEPRSWMWDEMERTNDGGVEMKVALQDIYQLPQPTQESDQRPRPLVRYIVRADPWGRIVEIKRDVE